MPHLFRLLMLAICLNLVVFSSASADEFTDAVRDLGARSFTAKLEAIDTLQKMRDERSIPILRAMMEGHLHEVEANGEIVIETETDAGSEYHNAFTGEMVEVASSRDLDKVRTNNRLRRNLRTVIASMELSASDPAKRMRAAKNLVNSSSPEIVDLVRQAYEKEDREDIKEVLAMALAILEVQSDDRERQLAATEVLAGASDPEALSALYPLTVKNDDGSYKTDPEVAQAAEEAIDRIQERLSFFETIQNVFFGISLGSVLLLAAVGLAITFGVMGVINMAHGEMIMLGAYTTYAVQVLFPGMIEGSLFIAIPAAFLVSGAVGMLIERLVIRHLYGRPLETLLATFGVSLILQQAVRTYRSNNVPVITPDWMSGSFEINAALSLTYNRFYIICFCFLVVVALMALTRRSYFGLQMRAVTLNRPMANAMGIRSGWVDALTFGLGSGIAGIAGVALSQLTNVGPNLGQDYIIDSFMVVVFGGVGNLLGTVFAALGLGVVNKFLEPVAGAVLAKIMVLVFIILFIQWRPRGLFALKGRSVED